MNESCRSLNLFRRVVRLGFFAACGVVASAQTPPYALFQQATLTGSGNTINATQVPVVAANGMTVYVNVNLQFNVDNNGNLTISSGFPQVTPAPALLTANFKAGRYVGPSTILGGKAAIVISSPGVANGGATVWTLTAANGADPNTYPSSGTWYVGPSANDPNAARITKAGVNLLTGQSFGVGGSQGSDQGMAYQRWYGDTLFGVMQAGNTITFYSYTYAGSDRSTPYDQITYTYSSAQ
jgi:hypothetical protein